MLWVHLDAKEAHAQYYIRSLEGLDSAVQDVLLADETRPRSFSLGDGLVAIFRGVNLNPEADPGDMMSLRLWVESTRILSTRRRPLMAVKDVQRRIESGRGPASTGALFVQLTANLVSRMSGVIETLDDKAGGTGIFGRRCSQRRGARGALAALRRQAISLRRYLAPQREALNRIQDDEFSWLDRRSLANLHEQTDRIIRYLEDLNLVRERCAVIQDELMNHQAEKMNKNMFFLSIVATVMLPLGLVTGLRRFKHCVGNRRYD